MLCILCQPVVVTWSGFQFTVYFRQSVVLCMGNTQLSKERGQPIITLTNETQLKNLKNSKVQTTKLLNAIIKLALMDLVLGPCQER